jgi:[ribosomal protein S5]-alanine N-acetyltransferase
MRVLEKTKHEGRSAANGGVTLELVNEAREREFLTLVRQSRQFHGLWVRPPSTPSAFREYVLRLSQPSHVGYFVCDADRNLVGVININEMVRGAMCSGALGYYAFAASQGAGYMTRGLTLVIRRAFTRHGLHRLEANLQLANERSRKLLSRLGFRFEGVARRLMKVGRVWSDHERWALTVEDWRENASKRRGLNASRQ